VHKRTKMHKLVRQFDHLTTWGWHPFGNPILQGVPTAYWAIK